MEHVEAHWSGLEKYRGSSTFSKDVEHAINYVFGSV